MPEELFNNDLGSMIRRARLFNPTDFNTEAQPIELSTPEQTDPARMFEELYKPETAATDRLNQLLANMPRRENPSTWRKIAAIGAAFGGGDNVEKVLYPGYQRNLTDWRTELDPAMKSAELERGNNINLRNMANNVVSQRMADRRLDQQLFRYGALERQGDRRLDQGDTRETRIAEEQRKASERADKRLQLAQDIFHKKGVLEVDDAGNARFRRNDGTIDDTIGTYLSKEEIAQLREKYPGGSASRDRFKTDTIIDPNDPTKQNKILVRINLDTNEWAPIGPEQPKTPNKEPVKPVTPTTRTEESSSSKALGDQRNIRNRATMLKNSNPQWSKWITFDKGGIPVITRPSIAGRFIGSTPDEATFKQISRAIFGNDTGTPNQVANGNSPFPSTRRADGKVPVRRKSDGRTGWMTPPVGNDYEELK